MPARREAVGHEHDVPPPDQLPGPAAGGAARARAKTATVVHDHDGGKRPRTFRLRQLHRDLLGGAIRRRGRHGCSRERGSASRQRDAQRQADPCGDATTRHDDGLYVEDGQPRDLKNWTARSWASAARRVRNVPRLRRLPVFGFRLRRSSACGSSRLSFMGARVSHTSTRTSDVRRRLLGAARPVYGASMTPLRASSAMRAGG